MEKEFNLYTEKKTAEKPTATSLPNIRLNRVYLIQIKYRRRLITHTIVIFDVLQTKTEPNNGSHSANNNQFDGEEKKNMRDLFFYVVIVSLSPDSCIVLGS